MDVVFAMQITLKGEFGKSVGCAIELFHSGFEFLRGASGQDQSIPDGTVIEGSIKSSKLMAFEN
jgi:hypothetical protein